MVDAIPPVMGKRGRPRRRPEKVHADKGYEAEANRRGLLKRGIKPRIARKRIESDEKLGRHRWVVERTIAWLQNFRRLRIRDERRPDIYLGFLTLGACLILFRRLAQFC